MTPLEWVLGVGLALWCLASGLCGALCIRSKQRQGLVFTAEDAAFMSPRSRRVVEAGMPVVMFFLGFLFPPALPAFVLHAGGGTPSCPIVRTSPQTLVSSPGSRGSSGEPSVSPPSTGQSAPRLNDVIDSEPMA